jgi:hypothetical protein
MTVGVAVEVVAGLDRRVAVVERDAEAAQLRLGGGRVLGQGQGGGQGE